MKTLHSWSYIFDLLKAANPMLSTLFDDLHDFLTEDPNTCVRLGVSERLGDLPDPSAEALAGRVRRGAELLARIQAFDRADLDFDQRLDLELAELTVESSTCVDAAVFNGHHQRQQLPSAGEDIGDGIFVLLVNDPRPARERLENIRTRLEQVPAYLEALLSRLETPVERWVKVDAERVAGLPAMLATVQSWAGEQGYPELQGLERARLAAERALQGYVQRLQELPTTGRFAVGAEQAAHIVSCRGIDQSLDQLHDLARRFLADNRAEIDDLRRRLAAKHKLPADTDAPTLQRHLRDKYPVGVGTPDRAEAILERYREELRRAVEFVGEHDLFPILEEQDVRILQTPQFLASTIPAGAVDPPAPFRGGLKTSIMYLTMTAERFAEHSELFIPSMIVHETIPGHHLQLATAACHPSIVRRHQEAVDFIEGWATMLEDYMLDLGLLGELTDEARFCGKHDIARLGARVAIDLYFMTGQADYLDVGVPFEAPETEDPFEQAGALLQAVTGFSPGRVEGELNWYSQVRGYPLSYLAGNHLMWELKDDFIAAQQDKLSGLELDRTFHRTVLDAGNMPVRFLRRVFQHKGLLPPAA